MLAEGNPIKNFYKLSQEEEETIKDKNDILESIKQPSPTVDSEPSVIRTYVRKPRLSSFRRMFF